MEYNIDEIVKNIDFLSGKLVDLGNGLMLTNKEIEVLDRYNIDYKSCSNLKEVLSRIEEVFYEDDSDLEDLDIVSESIAERDYYQNTNK